MIEVKKYLGKEFAFSSKISEKQDGLFTKEHTKFDVAIMVDGVAFNTTYQCNQKYVEPSLENVLECLYADTVSFDCVVDIDDFSKEFGITSVSKAIEDYKTFTDISNFMHKVFSDKEFEELGELIDNSWEIDEISMDL